MKDKINEFLRETPLWVFLLGAILLATIVSVSGFITLEVRGWMNTPSPVLKPSEVSSELPDSRKFLGVIILIIVACALIGHVAYVRWGRKESRSWKHILIEPPLVVVYTLVLVWLVIAFLIPKLWSMMWGDPIMFWSINVGLLVLSLLKSVRDKDNKLVSATQKAAWVFGVILLAGLISQFVRNPYWRGVEFWETAQAKTTSPLLPATVSIDDQLFAYGTCESPGEPGGKQFEEDKDGKPVAVKGIEDPDDTGALQINRRIHADLIKETGIDPATSKQDNYRLGRIILERYLANPSAYPQHPWEASRYCWENKIGIPMAPRVPMVLAEVPVPTGDKWSTTTSNPYVPGTFLRWDRVDISKGKDCKVMADGDPNKVFRIEQTPKLIPRFVQFQCADPDEDVEIRVTLVSSL